jgi:hypothetical protein
MSFCTFHTCVRAYTHLHTVYMHTQYCATHKKEGMVNRVSKTCRYPQGCKRAPSFGSPIDRIITYCSIHRYLICIRSMFGLWACAWCCCGDEHHSASMLLRGAWNWKRDRKQLQLHANNSILVASTLIHVMCRGETDINLRVPLGKTRKNACSSTGCTVNPIFGDPKTRRVVRLPCAPNARTCTPICA